MKKEKNKNTRIVKGVSTLDVLGKNLRLIILLLMLTGFSNSIHGGHSTLDGVDPQFSPQIQTGSFGLKQVNVILPLPDGKILVGGKFTTYNRQPVGTLVRLNSDGSLDNTFNMVLDGVGEKNTVNFAFLQSDGKIVAFLNFYNINGQSGNRTLIRLNSDGTLDSTFNYTGNYFIGSMAIDSFNRILLVELFSSQIVRLNPNGSLDTSFQLASGFAPVVIFTLQNNKIITVHATTNDGPTSIRRFNEDGSADNTFTVNFPNTGVLKLVLCNQSY